MVKISNARIDLERARVDNVLFKDYGEILVGGAAGANTGGAFNVDLSAGNMFKITLNATPVDLAFMNPGPSGAMTSFTLIMQQDSVGSRAVNWPSTVLWDGGITPSLTRTPGRMDIFSFMSPDGGRKWFGFTSQQNITGLNLSAATLWGWGVNSRFKLGTSDTVARVVPTAINEDSWSFIDSGAQNTFGIKTDGSLWGWGSNAGGVNGHLGDNTSSTSRSSPIQIGTLTDWAKVAHGSYRTSAIKTDGTLWAWGQNDVAGRLIGDNTTVRRSSPIQVGTLTNWATLPNGNNGAHAGVIDTSGRLWLWGDGSNGGLGQVSDLLARSSPTQVGTDTDWATFSIGTSTTHAIKTDGSLWAWGLNNLGQLGRGSLVSTSSPIQIGSLTDWSIVAAGLSWAAAVKTDGTLWTWGANTEGRLGDNTTTTHNSPVQVGTLTNWSKIAVGALHIAAIKTDGTLWAWGTNSDGRLGTGDLVNRSSPTQIGRETTWTLLAVGSDNTIALKT